MKLKSFVLVLILLSAFQNKYACAFEWPVLKSYDGEHSYKIALPVGGIGTGTISLGGRGNLQDFEIMSTPSKGYNPGSGRENSTFFTLLSVSIYGGLWPPLTYSISPVARFRMP